MTALNVFGPLPNFDLRAEFILFWDKCIITISKTGQCLYEWMMHLYHNQTVCLSFSSMVLNNLRNKQVAHIFSIVIINSYFSYSQKIIVYS